MKKLIFMLTCAVFALVGNAQSGTESYVVLGKTANVFDSPSNTAFTVNQFDEPIELYTGMAFEKLGETKFYYKVEFAGSECYISKKACVTPEPLGNVAGNHVMTVGEDPYPITVSDSGTEGQYHITMDYTPLADTIFVGTQISPELIIIKDPSSDCEGVITKVGGKVRVWIYDDNTIFPWR